MVHKKPHRIACIFFLMSISIFLSLNTAIITDTQAPIPTEPTTAQTALTNSWAKNNTFNDRLAYEHFLGISADAADNLWVWTMADDGQMYLSVGKNLNALNKTVQKVWYNIDAGISKQPTTLTNFSAGGVTKWTITHNAIWATKGIGPRPQVTIEGNLWAIFAPDPKNKPQLKLLYKSVNGKDGINWKQEETLTKLQKYPNIVSATNDGSVFVLCDDGVYKRYADGSWKPLIQEKAQAATSKATTSKDKTTKTTPAAKQPKLKYIAAANKDLIYALSEKNQVLIWFNETWEPLEKVSPKTDIKQIAVSPTGVLYCAANDGKVYFFAEKELAWRPCGTESIWNVQQVTASSNKIFAWTAELYKNALMKNQTGLTASDQGVIGVAASLGLTAGLILSPVGLIGAGVISIAASILSRPSNHEIYEWMGELPTPPEPTQPTPESSAGRAPMSKNAPEKPEAKLPPAATSKSTTKAKKPAAKVAPISPEKTTDDITAKLLKELAAMNKQTETPATTPLKVKPTPVVAKPAITPAVVKPATIPFKPATPAVVTPVVTQSPATTPETEDATTEAAIEPDITPETATPAIATPAVVPTTAPTEDITPTEEATPTEAAQTPDLAPTEEETPAGEATPTEAAPEDTNQEFDPLALLNK